MLLLSPEWDSRNIPRSRLRRPGPATTDWPGPVPTARAGLGKRGEKKSSPTTRSHPCPRPSRSLALHGPPRKGPGRSPTSGAGRDQETGDTEGPTRPTRGTPARLGNPHLSPVPPRRPRSVGRSVPGARRGTGVCWSTRPGGPTHPPATGSAATVTSPCSPARPISARRTTRPRPGTTGTDPATATGLPELCLGHRGQVTSLADVAGAPEDRNDIKAAARWHRTTGANVSGTDPEPWPAGARSRAAWPPDLVPTHLGSHLSARRGPGAPASGLPAATARPRPPEGDLENVFRAGARAPARGRGTFPQRCQQGRRGCRHRLPGVAPSASRALPGLPPGRTQGNVAGGAPANRNRASRQRTTEGRRRDDGGIVCIPSLPAHEGLPKAGGQCPEAAAEEMTATLDHAEVPETKRVSARATTGSQGNARGWGAWVQRHQWRQEDRFQRSLAS